MAFSIPPTIIPAYSLPSPNPVNYNLAVGSAIKDQPNGTETTMKKANDVAVIRAQENYKTSVAKYEIDFKAATIKADMAEKVVDNARLKKAIAITCVVAAVIGVVGVVIAA